MVCQKVNDRGIRGRRAWLCGGLESFVMPADHNSVIDAQARRILKPFGLARQGKSRVWIDDHGWWLIQVEFQPSSWSRGSYLNVDINWMLYEGNAGAFNFGSRVDVPFISAVGNENFEDDACKLALRAKEEVSQLRSKFATPIAAVGEYAETDCRSIWDNYSMESFRVCPATQNTRKKPSTQ